MRSAEGNPLFHDFGILFLFIKSEENVLPWEVLGFWPTAEINPATETVRWYWTPREEQVGPGRRGWDSALLSSSPPFFPYYTSPLSWQVVKQPWGGQEKRDGGWKERRWGEKDRQIKSNLLGCLWGCRYTPDGDPELDGLHCGNNPLWLIKSPRNHLWFNTNMETQWPPENTTCNLRDMLVKTD